MKWKKYTVNTTVEAEDLVSMMLNELGVEGVQIEDNVPLSDADTKGMFIDILPELPPDDGTAKVSFFLREYDGENDTSVAGASAGAESSPGKQEDASVADNSYTVNDRIWSPEEIETLLSDIRSGISEMRTYTDAGEGSIDIGPAENADWLNKWKEYFKPFLVGNVLIKPTWEPVPEAYAADLSEGKLTLIEMDPGTAFGTGTHETTKLCIERIGRLTKPGDAVLDLGTGTGILGIAALKSGAAFVTATDLDDACVPAVEENCAANGIENGKTFRLFIGNVLGEESIEKTIAAECEAHGKAEGYDLVIANILAPVIVSLIKSGVVKRLLRKGGCFLSSGIIDTRAEEVREALLADPDWELLEGGAMGEWRSYTARKL